MPAKKRELFRIGDVAKMFRLSVSSLRHYEKTGLVQPEYIDRETGYRYYSNRQFECLNTIRYLRVLDMPLPQIADFLKNREVARIQGMLCQQKEAVIRKQRELRSIERKTDRRLEQLHDAPHAEKERIALRQPQGRARLLREAGGVHPAARSGDRRLFPGDYHDRLRTHQRRQPVYNGNPDPRHREIGPAVPRS